MAEAQDAKARLGENWGIFTEDEQKTILLLDELDQAHIFGDWPAPGKNDAEKKALIEHCRKLNLQYEGGLAAYVKNAKDLLSASLEGANPFDGWTPSVPSGESLDFGSDNFMAMEALAVENLGQLGFVLVAGGLGERLGYSGIKVSLPTEITTETCYLDYYCQNILTLQSLAAKQQEKPDLIFPLAIMTSGDTHAPTEALLAKHNNFGMADGQITLMKQEKVPALEDNQAHFARDGLFGIQTKPHGHGDVHSLMYSKGVAQRWLETYGTKWTLFFQDTNAPVFRSYISALGVAKKFNFAMNTITIPRLPGQAVGGIALFKHDDGRELTINVEYNQLGPLLMTTGDKKGDVAVNGKYSPFPGNTNSFILDHELYVKILTDSKGGIPEFVNPKYTDDTKTKFKKPTRLECMMQEYPKLVVPYKRDVGITQLPDWLAMRPVKNNVKDAKIKYDKVGAADCGCSGEAAMYFLNREYIRQAGVTLQESERSFEDIPVPWGARIVLAPSAGLTLADVKKTFCGGENIVISETSTLMVKGDVTIKSLTLNGALSICAAPGVSVTIDGLKVENGGVDMKTIDITDTNIEEKYRIRGYVLGNSDMKVLNYVDP